MTLCDNYFLPSLGIVQNFPVKTAALPVMAVFFFIDILASVRAITIYKTSIYSTLLSLFVYILDIAWFPLAYRNGGHVKFYIDFVACYFWDYCKQLFGQNKKPCFHMYIYHIFAVIHGGNSNAYTHTCIWLICMPNCTNSYAFYMRLYKFST